MKIKYILIIGLVLLCFGFILSFFHSDKIKIQEMIIRTPSMEPCYWLKGSYYEHVDEMVQNARKLGIKIMTVLVRTVDDDFDKGAMMYTTAIKNTHVYKKEGVWTDAKLQYLIDKAHKAGLSVYAWFPVFNDPDLWDKYPAYRTQPIQNEDPIEKFCSPVNTNVRKRELRIIKEFMIDKKFGFDGLRLDYMRYQADEQDQSSFAIQQYKQLYGKNLKKIIKDRWNNKTDYTQYLNWRARQLSSFVKQVKKLIGAKKRLGLYLFPNSCVNSNGYFHEVWSGDDYALFKNMRIDIIPMLYWDIGVDGYTTKEWIIGNMTYAPQFIGSKNTYIPCFSLDDADPKDGKDKYWQFGINAMKKHGIYNICVFDWAWRGYNNSRFKLMKNILDKANEKKE